MSTLTLTDGTTHDVAHDFASTEPPLIAAE